MTSSPTMTSVVTLLPLRSARPIRRLKVVRVGHDISRLPHLFTPWISSRTLSCVQSYSLISAKAIIKDRDRDFHGFRIGNNVTTRSLDNNVCCRGMSTNSGASYDKHSIETLKKQNKILTVPNFLTGCRIVLTPVLGYMVLQEQFPWAAGLFFLAGFTDMIDGQIARRWPSQRSMFGTVLDPLADKFLISTVTITLTVVDLIPVWLTSLIVLRDIGLICASFWVRYVSLDKPRTLRRFFDVTNATMEFKPTTISKANTVLQLGLVMASMGAPILDLVNHPVLVATWYLTGFTTVVSGLSYVVWRKDTYTILDFEKQRKH